MGLKVTCGWKDCGLWIEERSGKKEWGERDPHPNPLPVGEGEFARQSPVERRPPLQLFRQPGHVISSPGRGCSVDLDVLFRIYAFIER